MANTSDRILLDRTVYLTDVVPIVQLLHAADLLIATDTRGEMTEYGYRKYSTETMNAIELIRKGMTDIIQELAAKTVPAK